MCDNDNHFFGLICRAQKPKAKDSCWVIISVVVIVDNDDGNDGDGDGDGGGGGGGDGADDNDDDDDECHYRLLEKGKTFT